MGRFATLVALTTLALGCAAAEGAPEVRLDRSACAHCGMLVSELVGAAAVRDAAGVRFYDDVVCLLADRADLVAGEVGAGEGGAAQTWVFDHASGAPVRAEAATFVRSPRLRTPMGGGIVAFVAAGAAGELAGRVGGELLGWEGLLAAAPAPAAGPTPTVGER